MLENILKSIWWDKLSKYFSFANSDLNNINVDDLFSTLYEHVEGALPTLTSSSFKVGFDEVLEPFSNPDSANVLIALKPTDIIIGYGGNDFLAGDSGDNILLGGSGSDYFSLGSGIDFVIGSNSADEADSDMASYLTASASIVVNVEYLNPFTDSSTPAPVARTSSSNTSTEGLNLLPNQDVYTPTYSDWLARDILTVSDFEVGPDGDFIDISEVLSSVGYTGTDPVLDGYIRFGDLSSGMKIQFDADGIGGGGAKEMVRILGLSVAEFSIDDNLSWDGSLAGIGGANDSIPNDESSDKDLFTFVSDDGDGTYDILYSIENIFGSDHDDEIHGHQVLNNILFGGLGHDRLFGEGGNDTLIGGKGHDIVKGGDGDDLLIAGLGGDDLYGESGTDTFKFDGSIGNAISANMHRVIDFTPGASGDILDVSELLNAIGYTGIHALNDGYVQIVAAGNNTHIQIDVDGFGEKAAQTLAVLDGVDVGDFSLSENLMTSAPKTLLVSILGQSNAAGLRVFQGDQDSGITRLVDKLEEQTDYNAIVSVSKDGTGSYVMPAIGGTRVDGNSDFKADDVWWFPDEGKPGEILIRAVEILAMQIAELRALGAVKPSFVWGQGESDAILIGEHHSVEDRIVAQDRYMSATLAVFNYIRDRLGDDVEVYIMETGRYNSVAAVKDNVSNDVIEDTQDGLIYIREAQLQLALDHDYIHLAASYLDLPMLSEIDPAGQGRDVWHYHGEEREIIGDRLGDFIALEQGFVHVLDDAGSYPLLALKALNLKNHSGMTINGNSKDNIVVGTNGDDILSGGAGDDALYGGEGFDQVVYDHNFDEYEIFFDNWLKVRGDTFDEGTDTLIDIEKVIFADGFYQNGAFSDGSGGGPTPPEENKLPDAKNDNFAANQDLAIHGNLLTNNGHGVDSDPDGDPLSVTEETFSTTHGSVVISENGDFVYTPAAAYVATDSFNYTLNDGEGGQDIGLVELTLNSTGGAALGLDSNDFISGDDGDDILYGGKGNDTLKGRNGNDTLFGGADADYLEGGGGDDLLYGGEGADTIKGSSGIDTFVYTSIGDAGDIIKDFRPDDGEKIDLTSLLQGVSGFDPAKAFTDGYLRVAQNGADVDLFVDMAGTAGGGFEVLLITMLGLSVSDVTLGAFILPVAGVGGSGNTAPIAQDDVFSGNQDLNITGNLLADNGNGAESDPDGDPLSVRAETLITAHGSVVISSNGDFVYRPTAGYTGVDSFNYTVLDGQGANDIGAVSLTLNSTSSNDIIGTSGNETLYGTIGNDIIRGLGGNDFLSGDDGDDILYGGDGDDTLKGRNGNDTLYGEAGDDYLEGSSDSDILIGGEGADTIKGSAGTDIFVYTSMSDVGDTILDFNLDVGEILDISSLLVGYDELSDAITDFVQITDKGTDSVLSVDADGGADNFVSVATLIGVTGMTDEVALETAGNLVSV